MTSRTEDEWVEPLLRWYAASARDLPWRRPDATPWAVLVSEVMLQQTPVARVLPVYAAWLHRWPTPAAVAAAPRSEAVRMWGKLGYPRRALRLHACATVIVAEHAGQVPSTLDDLRALPGIGEYTARAIAAFAFRQRQPVVDTNVCRVASRWHGGADVVRAGVTARDRAAVAQLLPTQPDRAARVSVALMELGALVCLARNPRCADCPVAQSCRWRLAGYPAADSPRRPAQRYARTDRQVRGRLLDILRNCAEPVHRPALELAWTDNVQRERALDSLVADGLIDPLPDGRFALPGTPGADP